MLERGFDSPFRVYRCEAGIAPLRSGVLLWIRIGFGSHRCGSLPIGSLAELSMRMEMLEALVAVWPMVDERSELSE